MKKISLLAFAFVLLLTSVKAEKRKILFIGNSYTYTNDLPTCLKQLALSLGDTLETDSYCVGGATFNSLSTDANTLAKLQIPGWDYVVLQAQSQEPAFSPAQVQAQTYPYAKKLDSLVHVFNPCAETVFFMTWGRKNGDAANCAAYPPICTFDGMQQRLRESYLEMSDDNNASCSPVGVAWRNFRSLYPAVELYNPDESHPSVNGTYLAACVFYTTIYQKSPVGAAYILGGVNATDAGNIQTVSRNTVLDSIENWQQYGMLPFSKFSYTINQNQVTFTNTSLRSANYEWDFGDGSGPNLNANPVHTFLTTGNFTVTLKAKSTCNKYSVYKQTISITNVPNVITDYINTVNDYVYFFNNKLYFKKPVDNLEIINTQGQTIFTASSLRNTQQLECGTLPSGIYFIKAKSASGQYFSSKFIVK